MNINGKDCSESTISNKMNYHFTQIRNKLADKIDDIPNKSFIDYLNNRNFNSMVLSTISASEIYLAINNFKHKVSRDELDISMKLIQEISSSIIVPLMYIFNKSFDDGLFPSFFKRSKIIPIFKSGDCNDFNNYRPISLNLQFSKILEKLFSNRLLSFCNKLNIINDEQFGFRKNISTLNSIETLQKKVIESLDSNKYFVGLFVDIKKAFDTVNHRILINKLDYYGIRGKPLDW